LYTIIEEDIRSGKQIGIVTDSIYAIRCATTYGKKCADTGWKKDIPNKEMVQKAYELYSGTKVEFIHVMAHTRNTDIHSLGNKESDRLATNAILKTNCETR
jgi:ribonuclease HI